MIKNNEYINYDFVSSIRVKDIPIVEFSRITTWEKQQTKNYWW